MTTVTWVVKPKGKPHFVVRWRCAASGKIRQKSTGTPRRREAERMADTIADELNVGVNQEEICWNEFCRRYKAEGMSHCRPSTVDKWMVAKRHVSRILNPSTVRDITTEAISRLRTEMARGGMKPVTKKVMSPTTIDSHLRHLTTALNWAEAMGLIPKAPRVIRPKRGGRRGGMKGRPITGEEFDRMLTKVAEVVGEKHAPSWIDLHWHGWLSGLRLNEVLQVSWDESACLMILDIDDAQPLLKIPADLDKGGRERMQPITPDWAERLRKVPKGRRTGYVVNPMGVRGPCRNLQHISARISKIGKLARIVVNKEPMKYASAHDWRRSFGERWAPRVMPAVLQQLMRHADIKTTMQFYVGQESRRLASTVWDWKEETDAELRDPTRDPSPTSPPE